MNHTLDRLHSLFGTNFTEDAFLGGQLSVYQPSRGAGFRAAIDTVCLAATFDDALGARVLDAGAGAGVAGLCLLARCRGARVTALELQPEMAELAKINYAQNQLPVSIACADLHGWDAEEPFDQIISNPPYLADGEGTAPPNPQKARAHMIEGGLEQWIGSCLKRLKPKGYLTLICRADHLDRALAACAGKAGDATLFPLWPGPGKPAKRIILRVRKGVRSPARVLAGLMLHAPGARYTPEAERILKDGAPIDLG